MQLSWDLHVHPGPSAVPRWGTGPQVRAACARAGVAGFVWKSHEAPTASLARTLAGPGPRAIGSVTLNPWAAPPAVAQALRDGALWVWGPTQAAGQVAWDLPLPPVWPEIAALLAAARRPLVLATGHLGVAGRRAFAEFAASQPHLRCSVTHSLYLGMAEVEALRARGVWFEIDLYTATRQIRGRPQAQLAQGARALLDLGAEVYLTTDGGQAEVGDPYIFSAAVLERLRQELGEDATRKIAIENPRRLAEPVVAGWGP